MGTYRHDLLSSTAKSPMLGVQILYQGDFWASLYGGFSSKDIVLLNSIWEDLNGFQIPGSLLWVYK
jgi:hypothetical protein